jgi:hypothetical protein
VKLMTTMLIASLLLLHLLLLTSATLVQVTWLTVMHMMTRIRHCCCRLFCLSFKHLPCSDPLPLQVALWTVVQMTMKQTVPHCCCLIAAAAISVNSCVAGDMVDSDADDDDDVGVGAEGSSLYEEGLVPLLMGLPGDLQTSASMLYDDEVSSVL